MLIWTTAGLIRLATLMNTRESSAGEGSGVGVSGAFSLCACCPEDIAPSGACWPKTIEPLDPNKPNPSERASAGVNIRKRGALFIESLNLFSIFVFYLCVEK
jgi:hypothetical protein